MEAEVAQDPYPLEIIIPVAAVVEAVMAEIVDSGPVTPIVTVIAMGEVTTTIHRTAIVDTSTTATMQAEEEVGVVVQDQTDQSTATMSLSTQLKQ
jgi:hypothetical protein